MLRMGVTLFLTSALAVLCRIADLAFFSSVLVKIICLMALCGSLALFIAVLCMTEYGRRRRQAPVRGRSARAVLQVVRIEA
jgi:hypothetical protein